MDLFSNEARRDPYPLYERLRASGPVARDPRSGVFLILDHAEVKAALHAPDVFSSQAAPPGGKPLEWLIFFDAPRHTKLRALVLRAFTPKIVAELEPKVREITRELLDPLDERGGFDAAKDLGMPLPLLVIAELLGVARGDRPHLERWSRAILGLSNMIFGGDEAAKAALAFREATAEAEAWLAGAIEDREARPRADLLSDLVRAEVDGERLSRRDVLGFFQLLLTAGTETSANLIGNAVRTFVEMPDVFAKVRATPELLPAAIEETLRHRSPLQAVFRETTRDVHIGGATIPARSLVLLMVGAANRDPKVFVDPDRFDLARDPNPHVAFGHGVHFCVGAALARMEAKVALGELARRFERLELADEPWRPRRSFHIHGPESFVIRARRAS